jgi:hypothetical protein
VAESSAEVVQRGVSLFGQRYTGYRGGNGTVMVKVNVLLAAMILTMLSLFRRVVRRWSLL